MGLVSIEVDERSTKMLEFIEPKIGTWNTGVGSDDFRGQDGLLGGAENVSENALLRVSSSVFEGFWTFGGFPKIVVPFPPNHPF